MSCGKKRIGIGKLSSGAKGKKNNRDYETEIQLKKIASNNH